MSDTVLQELNQGVLVVTLNRPAKKNAFNTEQWFACTDAINEARENDEVRVVVLTGAGKDFCSGQDLTEAASGPREGESPYRVFERALVPLRQAPYRGSQGLYGGRGGDHPLLL